MWRIMDNPSCTEFTMIEPPKSIYAWGSTSSGQLGVGGIEEEHLASPVELKFKETIKLICCGESHTVFVLTNGTVYTCGSNDYGQLGHSKARTRPEKVEGLEDRHIVVASAGHAHNLAVDQWGTLYAWGSDRQGQLGLGLSAVPIPDRFVAFPKTVKYLATKIVVQVATGYAHSIVLTNVGEIYTFGSNSHGQLGLGYANGMSQTKPCLVETLAGFPTALIAAGDYHSLALSASSSVFGWGKNSSGQIGVSDTSDKCQPVQLTTLRSLGVRYIRAGAEHSVFLTHDGGVFTCGNGMYGQLGHSSTNNEVLPRKILEFGSVIVQIACGRWHTLCLTDNNKLYSFGLGSRGQLGLMDNTSKNSPMQITALNLSVCNAIYAGGDQSFLLLDGGTEFPNVQDHRQYRQESQILTFTEERLDQMHSAVEPVDQDIMSLAEVLFAYPSIWNASFLQSNGEYVPSTWKNIGIDLVQAEKAFTKLASMKSTSLRSLIEQTILKELTLRLPHQLKLVEILRVYVLLPLVPIFYEGTSPAFPVLFAKRIQSLPQEMSSVVIKWMYDSPIEQIQRLISVYKKTIIAVLDSHQPQSNKDAAIHICLNLLSVLNRLNRNSGKLSYHTFTIPQLLTKINVKLDYVSWCKRGSTKGVYFCDFPFVFDAQAKTTLLQTDQILQMQDAMSKATTQSFMEQILSLGTVQANPEDIQYLTIPVSRAAIVHDTITALYTLTTNDLKKPLKVKFIGEEGEDAGGVKKEFFLLLIREILDQKYGMFRIYDESRLMWFNEESFEDAMMYNVIGVLCGLAIYNFIIINLPFPLALYKKLLDEKIDLQDYKELDPRAGRSFEQLLEYSEPDLEEVFGLTFEISQETFGAVKVTPLKPGGENIAVTKENRAEFVDLYINFIFNVSVKRQFDAFKRGFDHVCGSTVLPLFHSQELQAMVTGNEDYDWGELERNCTYKKYSPSDPTIILFWEVFHELSLSEKKDFLLFLTGSDRIPITGMKSLKIVIQPTADEKFLPVAHTCFNLLDLPRYQTKERLRYKLLQAIQHNEGFTIV